MTADKQMETPRPSRTRPETSQGYSSRYRDEDERSDLPPSSTPSAYGDRDIRNSREAAADRPLAPAPSRSERGNDRREDVALSSERPGDREGKYDERTLSRGYGGERSERDLPSRRADPSLSTPVPAPREADRNRPDDRYDDPTHAPPPSRSAAGGTGDKLPTSSEIAARSAYADARASASASAPRPPGSDVGTVTSALQQQLRLTSFYVRPGFGSAGKPLDVLANFFQVRAKDGRAKIIQ